LTTGDDVVDSEVTATKAERLAAVKRAIDEQHGRSAASQAKRGKRGAMERVLAIVDTGTFTSSTPSSSTGPTSSAWSGACPTATAS
jgi:acetyl-CoA carboxylase carboxyltransferase component